MTEPKCPKCNSSEFDFKEIDQAYKVKIGLIYCINCSYIVGCTSFLPKHECVPDLDNAALFDGFPPR